MRNQSNFAIQINRQKKEKVDKTYEPEISMMKIKQLTICNSGQLHKSKK